MMDIELKHWDHTCGDGCCYTEGIDLFIGGEEIKSFQWNAEPQKVIETLLNYLKIEHNIIETRE